MASTGTRLVPWLSAILALALSHAAPAGAADVEPSKAAPKLRLSGYFAGDFQDTPYQEAAFRKVLAAWKPSTAPRGKKVE